MDARVLDVMKKLYGVTRKIVSDGRVQPRWPYAFWWPDGRPFNPDWISHQFARLVTKAGIAHCTPHDLRRSFSTLAQRAGVDRHTVKELGGWSVVSVLEKHYTGDISEVHRKAMDRLAGVG